jgi:hypothetical protein
VSHLRIADGWRVEMSDLSAARHLVQTYHYSRSTANTATYCHGLFDPSGIQAGAAIWIPPTRAAAETVAGDRWQGVLCLSRLVVAPDVPTNGASFLLGRSMAMIDRHRWPNLLTYADTRLGHTGAIYRATNWREIGSVPAGDVWVHRDSGIQRGRKRGGHTLLASEMEALGFVRQPTLPKVKFVHP